MSDIKKPRTNYKRTRSLEAKNGGNGSATIARHQIIPVVKTGLMPRKPGVKHTHRKDITLPPTVADAAKAHADELGMSDQDYYNGAVVSFFQKVLIGDHTLIEPTDKCPSCGSTNNRLSKPNAPPCSGFVRIRVGVRFTDNIVKMLYTLSDDWFKGVWSHAFEASVRSYLGKLNPPPEGEGKVAGMQLPKGRPRKGETAEERLLRALGRGEEEQA